MLENIAKITKNKGDSKRSEVEDDICRLYNELSGSLLARHAPAPWKNQTMSRASRQSKRA